MQPLLWIWLLALPPIAALIDLMTSPATTSFGTRERTEPTTGPVAPLTH